MPDNTVKCGFWLLYCAAVTHKIDNPFNNLSIGMKKGLLVYKAKKTRKNIGDYVQSVAAEQYTGREVVYVEREHTHLYRGEPLQLIMNAWYMHVPESWPPSPDIVPLLTSMHINPDIAERMLGEKSVAYFKQYANQNGPVGCRDKSTEALLKAKGIPAYFSGCLTLTLGKTYRHNPQSQRVCFVDPHHELPVKVKAVVLLRRYFVPFLFKRKLITALCHKLKKKPTFHNMLVVCSFYQTYSKYFTDEVLARAEFIQHLIPEATLGSEEDKLETARALLRKYADSRLVVTSRIHAALPCLGMGTPVVFVLSDDLHAGGTGGLQPEAKGRFEGLLELFHVMENTHGTLKPLFGFKVDKKIGVDHNLRNKQHHVKLAHALDQQCTAFINNVSRKSEETAYSKS